jgi:hypothetical protein
VLQRAELLHGVQRVPVAPAGIERTKETDRE